MKFKGCFSKYDNSELQDIKSFTIRKYIINDLKEYRLIFNIYLNDIGIRIHKLYKKDIKSKPLIIFKYSTTIKINLFLKIFQIIESNKKLENIFELIAELISLNKINIIEEIKSPTINLIINGKDGREIFKLNIPKEINEDIINSNLNSNLLVYKLNPCLKNQDIISELCEGYWSINRCFCVFNSYHDNEVLLIYQNYDNNYIEIMKLINKQIIKILKNIKSKISFIEHFFDDKSKFDYLVIAFRNKFIKVYNISLNYEEILFFNNGDTIGFISCCLLLFKQNILITSIFGKKKEDYTRIYSMNNLFNKSKDEREKQKQNISLLKKLPGSNNIIICSIIFWENLNYKANYLIQLSNNNIQINDIYDYNLYCRLETNEYNKNNVFYSGCIYKESYLLCISNEGYVFLWNLISKILINKLYIDKFNLFDCLLWSNNYLIISSRTKDNKNSIIKILDISLFKIINNYYIVNLEGIACIKKIIHPKKGNSLLVSGENNKIILFSA